MLIHDLRYGIRRLQKTPKFTATVVITLALGIGASVAIFSVVNSVLLRPLNYRDSDQLVILSTEESEGTLGNTGYTTFVDWRERSTSFDSMVAIRKWGGL